MQEIYLSDIITAGSKEWRTWTKKLGLRRFYNTEITSFTVCRSDDLSAIPKIFVRIINRHRETRKKDEHELHIFRTAFHRQTWLRQMRQEILTEVTILSEVTKEPL